ncbi:DUF4916 domain-containing protein [Gordonia sp. ABSL49_1]|uniref:DUF4916 domain-containing protein n=1 Tax=Gordonia sp. ABSL49_1 TaxID=2920941 RepID=UPI001F100920|nr:DUF4916 domain-containing protein [Gordonia sp. ABSL49_1]MCH5645494.1 NUDIX hydrolase family protein [Gordonia sp. ABSL49_1]
MLSNDGRYSGWLSEQQWESAISTLPIPCVDFVPVRRDSCGAIAMVGIILRNSPFNDVPAWCHLGGRVLRGETIATSIRRHAYDAFGRDCPMAIPPAPRHATVFEWFPDYLAPTKDGHSDTYVFGTDPRKHAISMGFIVEAEEGLSVRPGGEALDFAWAEPSELDSYAMWPGSREFIYRLLDDGHALQR